MSLIKQIEGDLTKKMNEAAIPIERVTLLELSLIHISEPTRPY